MSRRRALRWGTSLVLAAVLVGVLVESGARLRAHLGQLTPLSSAVAALCVAGGLLANLLTWRAVLADLGSRLSFPAAARVFFFSQIGKYLPGSVWPFVAQMELGKEHGVPRSRSAAVGLITLTMSLASGLGVAAVALLMSSPHALTRYWWALPVLPLLAIALVPAVANRGIALLFRLARREPFEQSLSGRGLATALGWAVASWGLFGLQVAALAHALGARGGAVVPVSVGAFALAWTVGFLFVIAPAGAGIREAVLVVALAQVLDRDGALLLALVSRALMSLGDVSGVLLAMLLRKGRAPVAR